MFVHPAINHFWNVSSGLVFHMVMFLRMSFIVFSFCIGNFFRQFLHGRRDGDDKSDVRQPL